MSKTHKTIIGISLPLLFILSIGVLATSNIEIEEDVFINQTGEKVKISDFKGKVVLMNFIYTSCPNRGCDLLTLQLLRVQMLLKDRLGNDLLLVSISIDPQKDSPAALKEFAERFKADFKGWHFLTGKTEIIDKLREKYDVSWKRDPDGTRHHRVVIVLFDREGNKVSVYNDYNYDTEKIAEDIKKLLNLGKK